MPELDPHEQRMNETLSRSSEDYRRKVNLLREQHKASTAARRLALEASFRRTEEILRGIPHAD
jgi:hypothetical protein